VADSCWLPPDATIGFAGLTVIDVSTAPTPITVTLDEPVIEAEEAVIVAVPVAIVVASPAELMLATAGLDDVQVTEEVRS
jgi:hypothetical protein